MRAGWAEAGRDSCAEWIAWRCALTPRAAREHVRVARRLPELPETHAAVASGELSYAKVRVLTHVATPENESDLLRLSRVFTAAQLERTVRAYRRATIDDAKKQFQDACPSVYWNADGSPELHGRLAPEDGALLLRALDAQRDTRWKSECGSAEPRPRLQVTNREALVAVADAALAHDGEGRSGGERYQVVIHADEAVLTRDGEGSASSRTEARSHPRRHAGSRAMRPWCATAANHGRFREIAPVPCLPSGAPTELVDRNRRFSIGPATCASGSAETFDLAESVDAFFTVERKAARRARSGAAVAPT